MCSFISTEHLEHIQNHGWKKGSCKKGWVLVCATQTKSFVNSNLKPKKPTHPTHRWRKIVSPFCWWKFLSPRISIVWNIKRWGGMIELLLQGCSSFCTRLLLSSSTQFYFSHLFLLLHYFISRFCVAIWDWA